MDPMNQPTLEPKPITRPRARSNTATSVRSRKRPLSRASTTSVQSGLTQPVEQHLGESAGEYRKQWYDPSHTQQRFGALNHQMSAEDMVLHSASQLQNPREYDLDPQLGGSSHHHPMSYPQEEPYYGPVTGRQSMPADSIPGTYGEDSQIMEGRSDEQDDADSLAGAGPAKKASKSSAANELEMRQLFQANQTRTLPEVARELHGNERGPQSERTRQVFAMLWINQVCSIGKGSVPRGRVYANYVSRCATERVTVLNPASFGKLVRVLFPGLKTRRLGVRGESKYHYVQFSLKDDQPELSEAQRSAPGPSFNDASFATSFNHSMPSQIGYTVDRAAFPSPDVPQMPEPKRRRSDGYIKPHSVYHQPEFNGISQLESSTKKIPQRLKFAPPTELSGKDYTNLTLPSIEAYVPAGTDMDSASALTALYRSHCNSLVDALRFCREKTFFHLYTSFHGTLTMPVQKLFANPSIAPWIEECDFVVYQMMMNVIAPLTLQVVPKPVLDALRSISERLVAHIQSSFHGHPIHVTEAKCAPAALFVSLLDRLLRVNLTAHAAANMLSNPANRDQMYEDWIHQVRTRKVAECIPTRGMDDVVNLLLTELRDLLDPVNVAWESEGMTPYGEMAMRTGRQQQSTIHEGSTTQNVLDRWVNFLHSLAGKFPYATPAEIVWCVQSLGTAVMRDITISQGKSFGSWWVTKCWVDEMIAFLAEQGGFMEYKTSESSHDDSAPSQALSRAASVHGSRYSSGSDEFSRANGISDMSTSRLLEDPVRTALSPSGHDDSGIGIRTPDEDFSMTKYDSFGTDPHPLHAHGMNHSLSQPTMV